MMVIIHFGSFRNASKYNGIRVVLPKHIFYQSRQNHVCFVNLLDDRIDEIDTQFCYEYFKTDLGKMPEPFNKPDIVIFNGVYFSQYLKISKYYVKRQVPYIVCPHGSLTKGGQRIKSLKKKVANAFCFSHFIRGAAAVHFLSEQEKLDSRSFKIRKAFVASNGIETREIQLYRQDYANRKFIYIGRIAIFHKGLDLLIDALALIKDSFQRNKCHLDVYGPGDVRDIEALKKMVIAKDLQELVSLHGPVYDKDKEKLLMETDVFIQTSRMEGMPMGILEALSFGVPVLVTKGTNLVDDIKEYDCGWTSETNSDDISNSILKCIDSTSNNDRRRNALMCVKNEYSWDYVTSEILKNYDVIIGR